MESSTTRRMMARCLPVVVVIAACNHDKEPSPVPSGSAAAVVTPSAEPPIAIGPGVDLPEVSTAGLETIPRDPIVVSGSLTTLSLDGSAILALHDGDIASQDLEGSRYGLAIPSLRKAYLAKTAEGPRFTLLALDRRVSMRVLDAVLASLQAVPKPQQAHVAVHSRGAVMALPLVHHAAEYVPAKRDSKIYHPIVAVERHRISLLSTSSDGPGVEIVDRSPQDLARRLQAIVSERWPNGHRTDDDRKLLLNFDQGVTLDAMVPLIAALRMTDAGTELFPSVLLWWVGFDDGPPTDADRFGDLLSSDGEPEPASGKRRPGADLAKQVDLVRAATAGGLPKVKLLSIGKPSLTAATVEAKIRAEYIAGISACYADRKLGTALTVRFTVSATHPISEIEVTSASDEIVTCISRQVASWTFPMPESHEARFAVQLSLGQ